MTVGELIKKLQKYEEETEVLLQSHDERFICHVLNVGEDEYDRVYVLAGDVVTEWLATPPSEPVQSKSE